ncbi:MAG: outer membrane protein assembly factor BamA [Pseudomonadota bacterium]|nr:outer membrane protein assembly factor BamA [Pseudomonadota bacterium]
MRNWNLKNVLGGLAVLFFAINIATGSGAQVITDQLRQIRVEGAQRIEEATVKSYMGLRKGDKITSAILDKSLKSLFSTGLFADVQMRRDGPDVIVRIVENPIVNRVVFEGNKFFDDKALRSEIKLRSKMVFTRSRVQSDNQRLLNIYRQSGRFAAVVVPKVIKLAQNRVDLVFEINEGDPTEIRKIAFLGNAKFDDADLREVIQTKESAWYRIFGSADTYDPDRLTFDRELLRRHYLANGYADFRVVSAVAELTADSKGFFVTYTIEEGARYKFGKINISTRLKNIDGKKLEEGSPIKPGVWYDADKVEDYIGKLTDAVGELGYAFVDIRPKVRRDRKARTIDVSFVIKEGSRIFVDVVKISGNVRTLDHVIRREMFLVEGDAFNTSKLRRSRRQIRNLGFFDRIDVDTKSGSTPDKTVIDVSVKERSTGALSFGAGFSTTSGVLADTSISERNLLGRGQRLRFGLQMGEKQQQVDISFTEPHFLERRVSAGFDIFHTIKDLQSESSFDRESTGFALRVGYGLSESLFQRWKYEIRNENISDVPTTASLAIREQKGDYLTSLLGQTLIYDRRDDKFTPTNGYVIEMGNSIAGFGGDSRYLRNVLNIDTYYPLNDKWVLHLSGGAGQILGIGKDIRIVDRFFLGGNAISGFDLSGIGPRDRTTGDAIGGNWFYRARTGVTFPLGLPTEFAMRGRFFVDAGSVGDNDSSVTSVTDTASLRMSIGTGLMWASPIGPVNIDIAQAVLKEDFDKTEFFRMSFGTRF